MIMSNKTERKLEDVKNYDFYPETRLIFADCGDAVYYITMDDKSVIEIYGGSERGYLEGRDKPLTMESVFGGHDEAR
jgi:hypothetical protein